MTVITKKEDEIVYRDDIEKLINQVDNKYKGQLTYLFRDCEPVRNEVNDAKFDHFSMIRLTKDYHNEVCTTGEKCVKFETKVDTKVIKNEFRVAVGYNWLCQDFQKGKIAEGPSVTLGFHVYSERYLKSLGFLADFSLLKYDATLISPFGADVKSPENFKETFQYLELKLNTGVRLTYPKGRFRPSIQGGIIFISDFNRTNYKRQNADEQPNFSHVLKEDGEFPDMLGYFIGLEMNYMLKNNHPIFCGLNYEQIGEIKALCLKAGYAF